MLSVSILTVSKLMCRLHRKVFMNRFPTCSCVHTIAGHGYSVNRRKKNVIMFPFEVRHNCGVHCDWLSHSLTCNAGQAGAHLVTMTTLNVIIDSSRIYSRCLLENPECNINLLHAIYCTCELTLIHVQIVYLSPSNSLHTMSNAKIYLITS